MNKFEKLVEFIINEDEEKAQDLFHEIVVEKSREIYNNLVNEADQTDDFVSDIESDEEGSDINFDDNSDDDMDDMSDMDSEEGIEGEEELEDRVVDLEAALDELKAEFDSMMSDEDNDGDIDGHEHDMDDMDDMDDEEVEEEFTFEADNNDDDDEEEVDEGIVREYTEKVAPAKGEDNKAVSPVAGKNDMGGTTANIAKGGTETGGKVKAPQTMNTGNRNVPGGKADSLEKAPAPKKGE